MQRFFKQPIHYNFLVLLIVTASAVRIFVCFQHNPMDYLVSDMLRHWNNGLGFPRGGYTGAADPIGYQVYVCMLQKLFGANKFLMGLAAAFLSVLMPWTYYRAARNFGLQRTPALWVWVLIGWTPSLLVIYHYIMAETLLLFLEGIALWMTARYLRKGGSKAFLITIFCWTIASLTKPTVIPLAVVCVLWSWWKRSTPVRDIAIASVMAVILLLPQAIRSKVELGFYAPFGNPWAPRIVLRSGAKITNFHLFGHQDERFSFRTKDAEFGFGSPSGYVKPLEPLSQWQIRRAKGDSTAMVLIDSAHGERDWKKAYAKWDNDREEWMAQWRENIILFFFAPSWPESSVGQWDGNLEHIGRWLWAPLIAFVFVSDLREFLHRRFDLIPVAVIVLTCVLAFQNTAVMEGRYRKPVEPLLFLNLVWVVGHKQQVPVTSEMQIA